MTRFLLAGALALCAAPALAQTGPQTGGAPAGEPQMNLEQKTLLRCSAAFAITAGEQARGVQSALAFPPLAQRGKEFFVQSSARLMDEMKLSREQVQALYKAEAERLQADGTGAGSGQKTMAAIMQPCLLLLDASGI
ncbi:hypothetical protein H0274_14675 [Altererythrobacter sp. CC-YST694]|uniref:hypothetical protein n=1 Tax=Altererythrobacter sp. CC-YST694 TaxID=2755038 RepID=UPI001D016C4F|nr:hypothetical protein [Altererythrobacter sp. CC-YST694]MCB5426505.1 hypothetical protein [Altererythrobacter sp. CC-YST694]